MTEVQLFKNCKIDNINRVSSFTTLTQQNNYYQGLINNGNGLRLRAINFQRLGDPMNVNYKYDDIFEYCYGRIKLNDYWYYFSVNGLRVVQSDITGIGYRFDAWETTRLQFGARLGAGYVERGKITSDNIRYWLPQTELQPRTVNITTEDLGDRERMWVGLLTVVHNSKTNQTNINYIQPKYNTVKGRHLGILDYWEIHEMLNKDPINRSTDNKIAISDIRGAWVIPFKYPYKENSLIYKIGEYGVPYNPSIPADGDIPLSQFSIYGVNKQYPTMDVFSFMKEDEAITLPKKPITEDTKRSYITDMRGSEVFSAPYGKETTNKLKGYLDLTLTSCKYVCWLGDNEHDMRFTIPGEPIPVMGDAHNEYFARQRMTDIESRRIARNQQLQQSVTSSLTSAATGGILGGIGAGAGVSAGVAGGASVAGSIIDYAFDTHFGHQQQKMLDTHYKHQRDELLLHGDSLNGLRFLQLVTEEWDPYSKTRFNNYVGVNGYAVHHTLPDCNQFYVPGGTLKGDFDIEGNMPENWKKEIRERFGRGVRIIDVEDTPGEDTPVEEVEFENRLLNELENRLNVSENSFLTELDNRLTEFEMDY